MAEPVSFLLVDDSAENLLALTGLLRRDGLALATARSGAEALELLLKHDFALALIDVQMPGMDGFELAELMRGTERTRQVPIIFITAIATDEQRRFRGYEAGCVDYLMKPIEPHVLRSKADLFFRLATKQHALARQRDEIRIARDRLQAHADNSPLAVIEFNSAFRVTFWSAGAERLFGWSAAEVMGKAIGEFAWVHEDDAARVAALSVDMLAGKAVRNVHANRNYRKDGTVVHCEWYNSALLDAEGGLHSVRSQVLDVTERKHAANTQRLLIGELNHRIKNTLATVQAIAQRTLRHSSTPAAFVASFMGRLQSLSAAHTLISAQTWSGADLMQLVDGQLAAGALERTRLAVSGPPVHLAPQMALHVALMLHELVTNAVKYGALKGGAGGVRLDWTLAEQRLRLTWQEQGGPAAPTAPSRGFGSTLIESTAQASGGSARAAWRPEGVTWFIELPLDRAGRPGEAADRPLAEPRPAERTEPAPAVSAQRPLADKRVLVIEDEPLIALDLAAALEEAGGEVLGPAATPGQALQLLKAALPDAALLDGNLKGERVDGIAAALSRANVPFAFVTGYGRDSLPAGFETVPILLKPCSPHAVVAATAQLTRPTGGCSLGRPACSNS